MSHPQARDPARGAPRAWWTALALAAACGGPIAGVTGTPLPGAQGTARLELQASPVVSYDAATGKTRVVLDFLVRDGAGKAVDPAAVTFRRFVDGRPADVESVPDFTDTKLASDLTLGMVLDASYSMTTWQPPAFASMKQAALDSERSIRSRYQAFNAGTFQGLVTWFQDRYLCSPSSPVMPDSAVLDIPTPQPGDSTKLLAATSQMVDSVKAAYDASPARHPSDQFAIVLFTDGWDNYSWHDDSAAAPRSYPASGGSFACAGPGPTTLAQLVDKITAFPALKVHVIALGNEVKVPELLAIANAGRGRLVANPDSSQVAALFAEITREFTTVRRDGLEMPLPPGDYEYVETATVGASSALVRFRFHAGDAAAAVDPASVSLQ